MSVQQKRRKRPTLKSIADRTGLAITTVSKALRGKGNLNEDTIALVRSVAAEVGYHPDLTGVGLRTGRTYVIQVAFNRGIEISDFERQIMSGVASALRETPYEPSFYMAFPGDDEIGAFRSLVRNGRADGVIFADIRPQDRRVKLLQELEFPFVTHGRTVDLPAHAFYDFDNEKFAYLAAKHLAKKGRKKIAIACQDPSLTFFGHAMDGLRRAAREDSLEIELLIPTSSEVQYSSAIYQVCMDAIASDCLPDGIISSSDIGTLAIVSALANGGAKLGHDVDIVSRKTSSILNFSVPTVDTISEDLADAGEKMAKLLLQRIAGELPEKLQIIDEPIPDWRN